LFLPWFLLPTLIIIGCVRSSEEDDYNDISNNCDEKETFELADMGNVLTFSGKATCYEYKKVYQFNPDINSTKGRVLTVNKYSGSSYMNFDIFEFTTHPSTGILVEFTRSGYSGYYDFTFTGTITETPLHHHCPFPFIDLQPYVPVVLEDTVVQYHCDVLVTAPEDYEIRIDHIKDTDASHNTVIKLNDGGNEIERFTNFPVEETMTGSRNLTIDVYRKSEFSHQLEIQISAVKLNCTCGPAEVIVNNVSSTYVFQSPEYPKRHCKMFSCQRTFTLPVELRKSYKMQLEQFYYLKYGWIEIDDGPNGVVTRNSKMTGNFAFESPLVTLKY
ncbi:hypothetical protein PMAYCL1PPCAC_01833, partial [Pristionchus mayeri]